MRKEYYAVYSEEVDRTFIIEDVFDDDDELFTTSVTGFYFGRPNDESTELYKFDAVARVY
mgnify:CR=1 FL=1